MANRLWNLRLIFVNKLWCAGGRERKQAEPNDKTASVLGQRGCSRRNPVKAPSWAEVSVQNPHSKEAPDSQRKEMKRVHVLGAL